MTMTTIITIMMPIITRPQDSASLFLASAASIIEYNNSNDNDSNNNDNDANNDTRPQDSASLFLVSAASPVDPFPATASAAPTCVYVRR